MSRTVSDSMRRDAATLRHDEPVSEAVAKVVESGLPALPVVDADGTFCGIFGEREFIGAAFPGYIAELKYAAMVPKSLEQDIEKRRTCLSDPVERYMTTEHVDVPEDYSDVQLAETFLHHRVLIVPVVDDGRVTGVVTRSDFFRGVAEKLLG